MQNFLDAPLTAKAFPDQAAKIKQQTPKQEIKNQTGLPLAQAHYQNGDYEKCWSVLASLADQSSPELLWAKLSCAILLEKNVEAVDYILKLSDHILTLDKPTVRVAQQVWLMHRCLFVLDQQKVVDLLLETDYLMAIQNAAPHLLKYLLAAVICADGDVSGLVPLAKYDATKDPLVQFIKALYVDFDLETSGSHLKHITLDQFIPKDLIKNCQEHQIKFIVAVYHKISLKDLKDLLNVQDQDQLVKLIQAQDAQVKGDFIEVKQKHTPPLHNVIEKVKDLAARSEAILNLVPSEQSV